LTWPKGKSPRVPNLANREDEVPVSFNWNWCNPLTFSQCVVEHYQNASTTCLAVFPRSAASDLRLWPRYHLYNKIILCIEFAPLREGFQNIGPDRIPHDRQHKLRWLNCVPLPIDNNFWGAVHIRPCSLNK
jgi:hypothetical protein